MKIQALIVIAVLAVTSLQAQQGSDSAKPVKPEGAKELSTAGAYRFQYTLTELNGKQKINEHRFECMTSDKGSVLSISKIAVPVGAYGAGPILCGAWDRCQYAFQQG